MEAQRLRLKPSDRADRPRYIYGFAAAFGRLFYRPESTLQVVWLKAAPDWVNTVSQPPCPAGLLIDFHTGPVVILTVADYKLNFIMREQILDIAVEIF